MMALLCSTMGYATYPSYFFKSSTQEDDKISLINNFDRDLCAKRKVLDLIKIPKTLFSYKNIKTKKFITTIIDKDPENLKLIKKIRDIICYKSLKPFYDTRELLKKSIEKGEKSRYITTLLLNNTSELALSFNNVIFFKILIKNQDKYEPKTAIAITDHFLKLGMSPRHTRTRQEIIEWPSLGKFDTYICNNCDGKTHPVCQHLQQKEVQKKKK